MFKATINSEKIKDITSALKALVYETKVELSPEGIAIRAVDAANVAMVSIDIGTSAFESFEATEGEIALDLNKLSGILEMAEKDGKVELELDEKDHKLKVRMGTVAYDMSLLDPSSVRKSPKVPSLDLPGKIHMKGEEFRRGIKASAKITEYMTIGVRGTTCIMEAIGDTDSVKLELKKEELIDLCNSGEKDVTALFSLDYLEDIAKIAAKADEISIEVGQDLPVKIGFDLFEGTRVGYMMAPRVESQ